MLIRKSGAKELFTYIASLDEDDKLLYQAILSNFCKPLLKLLSDSSEKIRETTLVTLKILLQNCDTVS